VIASASLFFSAAAEYQRAPFFSASLCALFSIAVAKVLRLPSFSSAAAVESLFALCLPSLPGAVACEPAIDIMFCSMSTAAC
jgi:hypothetical protein